MTVTEGTLAAIEALTPAAGDRGFPTDSGYVLVAGNSGWLYTWDGYAVEKPPTSGWTLRNAGGVTTLATDGGVQKLVAGTGTLSDKRIAVRGASSGNAYIFGLDANILGANCQVYAGFYETGSTKNILISWRGSAVTGGADSIVGRFNDLTSTAASTPVDIADSPSSRQARFVKLAYSGTTLSWSVGPSAKGPWQEYHSEAENAFFTTAPDEIFFGVVNNQTADMQATLYHYATEAA